MSITQRNDCIMGVFEVVKVIWVIVWMTNMPILMIMVPFTHPLAHRRIPHRSQESYQSAKKLPKRTIPRNDYSSDILQKCNHHQQHHSVARFRHHSNSVIFHIKWVTIPVATFHRPLRFGMVRRLTIAPQWERMDIPYRLHLHGQRLVPVHSQMVEARAV